MFTQGFATQDFPFWLLLGGCAQSISDHQDDFGFSRLSLTVSFSVSFPSKLLVALSHWSDTQLWDSTHFWLMALWSFTTPWVILPNNLNQMNSCPFRLAPSFFWVDMENACYRDRASPVYSKHCRWGTVFSRLPTCTLPVWVLVSVRVRGANRNWCCKLAAITTPHRSFDTQSWGDGICQCSLAVRSTQNKSSPPGNWGSGICILAAEGTAAKSFMEIGEYKHSSSVADICTCGARVGNGASLGCLTAITGLLQAFCSMELWK